MSTKTKNTLFRRNRNRDSGPDPVPARDSTSDPPPDTTAATAPPAAATSTAPAQRNGGNGGNGGHGLPPTGYRGADAINADASKHVGDLKKNTSDGVRGDLKDDIGGISPGVNGLLTPSEKKANYGELPTHGGHFLEPSMQHLHNDFLDRWKKEMLFPNIQRWVDVYLVEYIQNLLHQRTEGIIKKYEETIAAIEEKHKEEIIELERAHKELLTTVVRKTWADYEKKMQNSRVVKQVHFGFHPHPSGQKEAWGDDIHDVVPEVLEHVPSVYEPEVGLEDYSDHPDNSHGHHHSRHHKHKKHAADPADPAVPADHDREVMEQPETSGEHAAATTEPPKELPKEPETQPEPAA